jgi:hypothetical protein
MGTCLGDLLVRPFFALTHFHVLRYSLKVFHLCLFPLHFFPSMANNTHILNPTHVITLTFDHFASHLVVCLTPQVLGMGSFWLTS